MLIKHVLVFPCGSEIGLELHRSLSRSIYFRLFGASSVPDHGSYLYERYDKLAETVYEPEFAAQFNALLRHRAIDYVIPAHDAAIMRLAELQDQGELAAEVIAPDYETCRICRYKSVTYSQFGDVIKVPKIYAYDQLEHAPYPLFVKPDAGQGSRDALPLPDFPAARERIRHIAAPLIMEYLPGAEYTVDCFTDRYGRLLFQSARLRRRIANGISVDVCGAERTDLYEIGRIINSRMKMRDAWFFQARENREKQVTLLEIAPRIAGTSGFQRAKGVNLAMLSLFDRMNLDVEIMPNQFPDLEMDRALAAAYRFTCRYSTAYIDFDDTVRYADGTINTDAVKFIFQCRNRGIRVVLLTRHIADIHEDLAKQRLTELFDQVINVKNDQRKSDYITDKDAIFIDDSFSEREQVYTALGIPVFDPSALEALIDDKR